jgi:hypothetical protein
MPKYDLKELKEMGIVGTSKHLVRALIATICAVIVCIFAFIVIVSNF